MFRTFHFFKINKNRRKPIQISSSFEPLVQTFLQSFINSILKLIKNKKEIEIPINHFQYPQHLSFIQDSLSKKGYNATIRMSRKNNKLLTISKTDYLIETEKQKKNNYLKSSMELFVAVLLGYILAMIIK